MTDVMQRSFRRRTEKTTKETNQLTVLARSPASGKYSPTWHWSNACKSVFCRHIGTYSGCQIPTRRSSGGWSHGEADILSASTRVTGQRDLTAHSAAVSHGTLSFETCGHENPSSWQATYCIRAGSGRQAGCLAREAWKQ